MPLPIWKRMLLWAALLAPACALFYGIFSAGLFSQLLWDSQGLFRFEIFTAGFLICSALVAWLIPSRYPAIVASCAFLVTIGVVGISPVIATALFLASAYAVGRLVHREPGGLALVTGTALYIFLWHLLVRFPVNYPLTYLVIFVVPLLVNRSALVELWQWIRAASSPVVFSSRFHLAATFAVTFVTLLQWAVTLKPEVSGDGLAMHLAVPAAVANQHRWDFDAEHLTYAVMPMGGDWCYTAVYLLGGEFAARLLNLSFLLIVAVLLYGFVRRWLSHSAALLIAALWIGSPLAQLVTGALFVENSWTLILMGAFLALVTAESGYAMPILLGTAMSMKFGSLAFLGAAALTLLFFRRTSRTVRLLPALSVFAVCAAPAYLTAYLKTRNPIFPFANDTFKSPYFDTKYPFRDIRFHEPLSWNTLYEITIHTSKYFEGQNGAFGFEFLLLLPLAILALLLLRTEGRRQAGAALFIAVLFIGFTFAAQANARYAYPVIPLLLIAIAWTVSVVPKALAFGAVAAAIVSLLLNVWFLPSSNWYHKGFVLLTEEERIAYLKRGAPVRHLVEYLNLTHPGEPVIFFGNDQFAGLQGRVWSDTWRHQTFQREWNSNSDARRELDLAHSIGARYFIAPAPETGRGAVWIGTRRFLSICTEPEFRYGDVYVAALKPSFLSGDSDQAFRDFGLRFGAVKSGLYDDTHPAIRYEGVWTTDQQFPRTLNQTVSFSNKPGNSFTLSFEGTEVTWIFTRAENRGVASVLIDDQQKDVVDLYAPETEWQARMTFDSLHPGKHSISVVILEGKNPASKDRYVDVDAIQVGSTPAR